MWKTCVPTQPSRHKLVSKCDDDEEDNGIFFSLGIFSLYVLRSVRSQESRIRTANSVCSDEQRTFKAVRFTECMYVRYILYNVLQIPLEFFAQFSQHTVFTHDHDNHDNDGISISPKSEQMSSYSSTTLPFYSLSHYKELYFDKNTTPFGFLSCPYNFLNCINYRGAQKV